MIINSLILAGGLGSRLQPVSTPQKPKQFHDFFGSGKSLLQDTVTRAAEFSKVNKIFTIGSVRHQRILSKQLRTIDYRLTNKIIFEPLPKNTAASIFLAAKLVKKDILAIIPSDHYISGDFNTAILEAAKIAEEGKIVTFGIEPSEANTNYGYILENRFLEKPNAEVAQSLIEKGALWNSGIFVVKVETLLAEYKKHAPEFFGCGFSEMPKLPFDKAIMEKTDNMHCLKANFEWDDLGSWESLARYNSEVAYKYAA